MSFMKLMISICFTLSCMLIVYGAYQLSKCVIVYFDHDMGLNILAAIVLYLQKSDWNLLNHKKVIGENFQTSLSVAGNHSNSKMLYNCNID